MTLLQAGLLTLSMLAATELPEPLPWVVYPGRPGLPGSGKRIALLAGDEEYRSEEALPQLAKILSQRHGLTCTVHFSQDAETGEIDPGEQTHLPGLHLLERADMLVCFLRFRELPDADMKHFASFVESKKPIFGIRTSTHAFDYTRDRESAYADYSWRGTPWEGGFGRQVLGETWVAHHGGHGSQATRGVIEPGAEDHPLLRGVVDPWCPTDVYTVRGLPEDARILLRGAVLDGMEPDSVPVVGEKNEPMMPVVWVRDEPRRVVCSTLGCAQALASEGTRRLFVNAVYWGLGLEDRIDPRSDVALVGEFEPSPFGFGKFVPGRRPADHALPRREHVRHGMSGFTILVDRALLDETHRPPGAAALQFLGAKLSEIVRVLPAPAVEELRQVPIHLDLDHPLEIMQYHPSERWLLENGHDPALAKCVHIPNAARMLEEAKRNVQPWVVLHELAHAYHDRVLGFDEPRILEAYERAVASKRYEKVLHAAGYDTRHYALTDAKEFFAELTESYFGTNDFYPFVRAELERFDGASHQVIRDAWLP